MPSPYETGLDRNQANHTPLTPLAFLRRAAEVFPDRVAVIHGDTRHTWRETYARCRRLASALSKRGVGRMDTVAVLAPNIPAIYEAHFGVPMAGAVLNTLNTRLDPQTIAFMLRHGEAKVLLVDREFSATVEKALALLEHPPLVIDIDDPLAPPGKLLGEQTYEAFLEEGDPDFAWENPTDEWDAISLNYTSGTTGDPKGVVYHHRGAYLNAVSAVVGWSMGQHPIYLWTVPMFHCNGWCFPWAVALVAGTNVCLRRVDGPAMLDAIHRNKVTHMCGAPIVFSLLIAAAEAHGEKLDPIVHGQIAAAPPPASVLEGAEKVGLDLTHVYGLTENYGPASICAKQADWAAMDLPHRAERNGRQGVRALMQEEMVVLHPETMASVPWDGETMGEIMFRGNITMKGYLKNPSATEKAFAGGYFHTGDLAVTQPDGYIKIKDRSKDIIISGGENISSVEVEEALYRHPAVMYAAVVAQPDEKWGETPCAFVELKAGVEVTSDEMTKFCRRHLAGFKVPKRFVFTELPKTSTGKIQKFMLREQAKSRAAIT